MVPWLFGGAALLLLLSWLGFMAYYVFVRARHGPQADPAWSSPAVRNTNAPAKVGDAGKN